jgi:hypothetical protein
MIKTLNLKAIHLKMMRRITNGTNTNNTLYNPRHNRKTIIFNRSSAISWLHPQRSIDAVG